MENEAWFPEYCLTCIVCLAVQKKGVGSLIHSELMT